MKNTILKTTVCAAVVIIGTSAFAGDCHHGPHGSSGVRLATDIVNLVGSSLNILRGPTVVYTEPATVVYTEPAPVVYTAPVPASVVYTAPVYCPPRPYYYRPLPPPPPRHHHHGPGPRPPHRGPGPRR